MGITFIILMEASIVMIRVRLSQRKEQTNPDRPKTAVRSSPNTAVDYGGAERNWPVKFDGL